MQWFTVQFPNHPSRKVDHTKTKFVIQTICSIHGTKDTGIESYKLQALIFVKVLDIVLSTTNKGLVYWFKKKQEGYSDSTTDDILMASIAISLFYEVYGTLISIFIIVQSKDLCFAFSTTGVFEVLMAYPLISIVIFVKISTTHSLAVPLHLFLNQLISARPSI